ncbi:MAG TPA: transposase [Polyangiaceae bacterium]|nr:transposase [Polyangiaceae bacterium]
MRGAGSCEAEGKGIRCCNGHRDRWAVVGPRCAASCRCESRGLGNRPADASLANQHVVRAAGKVDEEHPCTERRDNRPMRKPHDSVERHSGQIVAPGEHHLPTGRIEALNDNWGTAVRQGRGYRDLDFLMLKVRISDDLTTR